MVLRMQVGLAGCMEVTFLALSRVAEPTFRSSGDSGWLQGKLRVSNADSHWRETFHTRQFSDLLIGSSVIREGLLLRLTAKSGPPM